MAKITTANDLRGALLGSIEKLLNNEINIGQANAIVGLSAELHKSIKQEWEMRKEANEIYAMDKSEVIALLVGEKDGVHAEHNW